MLGQLDRRDAVVIADLEAGVGTLTRMAERTLDALVVVAEPSSKSIEVARRARDIARERGIGPVRVVANRVRGDDDLALIRDTIGAVDAVVPDDAAVLDADRDGRSPLDVAEDAPAVTAIARFARSLRP